MITYSGCHITNEFGAPTIRDIAVQSMRLFRFAGAGRILWPIGMHSLLVADLLPLHLEVDGLLHDSPEIVQGGDINQPFKTDQQRGVEDGLLGRIYQANGLVVPTFDEHLLIKAADIKAVCAEGEAGCAARGFVQTQRNYRLDPLAAGLLARYLRGFDIADCLNPDGKWPVLFEKRLRRAIRRERHSGMA